MKVYRPDGSFYYYYYKKKVGRHKKTGPKKRKKKRGSRKQATWDYKILQFVDRKQTRYIGVFRDLDEVAFARRELEKMNNAVVFPKKYANNGAVSKDIYETFAEYVIMKRDREKTDDTTTRLRNEYGKFVEHKTTAKEWVIYDKFPCLIEESFWVYGYDPRTDRKEFKWIYHNLVEKPVEEGRVPLIIYAYNNKLIFKYDEDFDFVICKNTSDAIRMYNEIEERTRKIRPVYMVGMVSGKTPRTTETIEMIRRKTGWDITKISRKSTRA